MLLSKIETVQPLLASVNGIHLTLYLKNRGDLEELKDQIDQALDLAKMQLTPVMDLEQRDEFLAPLVLFGQQSKRLRSFKRSIGIFRTARSFRVLNLPLEVESSCIIADSFHIKPLLKWLQIDQEFLLLGLEHDEATLYQGNLNTLNHIDTVFFPQFGRIKDDSIGPTHLRTASHQLLRERMNWLNSWIIKLTPTIKPRLFVAGSADLTEAFLNISQYKNTAPNPIWPAFSEQNAAGICSQIRIALKADVKASFEKAIAEFQNAVNIHRASGNLFDIAKAAIQGRIKKLLIGERTKLFGNLNRKNGEVKLNGRDLDHRDDDILDDIAQAVIASGGQVTVADENDIPKKRAILAIMKDNPERPSSKKTEIKKIVEPIRERSLI